MGEVNSRTVGYDSEGGESLFCASAKLRKAIIIFVVSVPASVRMEQLGSHRTDFYQILYLLIFRKTVEKMQVTLKLDKNKGYFT
jgi:hypothetical protein